MGQGELRALRHAPSMPKPPRSERRHGEEIPAYSDHLASRGYIVELRYTLAQTAL
jgi:hypothetical protein